LKAKLYSALAISGLFLASTVAGLLDPSGLRAQYFHGAQFSGPVVRSALQSIFTSRELSRHWGYRPPETFSVQWTGYLFVDRPATYTITINADDGSRLFIDRQPIIDERGQGPGIRRADVQLGRGSHPVVLQYVQAGGAYHLEVLLARDGQPAAPIPPWSLSPRIRGLPAVFVARYITPIRWALLVVAAVLAMPIAVRSRSWAAFRRRAASESQNPSVPSTSASRLWLGFALFAGLAIVQTWPLATNPARLSRNDNADTVLNEWILAWIAHQLANNPLRLFDANIFYPERHSLAFSEPLIVQSLLGAPLMWLGASPVLVYNLVLLAGLALTGFAMAVVVARWTGDWCAGVTSGIVVAFNAHTLTRLPHLQAQHAEFLPLALFTFDSLLRMPRWKTAVQLGFCYVLQALTSIYLLVFTTVALAVAFFVRPEDWIAGRFKRLALPLGIAAALAVLALLPFLLPYWSLRTEGFERSLDEVGWFSASAPDYWSTPSRLHGWLETSARGSTSLFPGAVALGLAGIGCLAGGQALRDRRLRMSVVFGLAGFVLSFGPIVPGYSILYTALPIFQAVRGAARFGYLAIVAVAIAAGFGVAALRQRLFRWPQLRLAGSYVVVAMVFLEPLAAPITYERFEGIPAVYKDVAGETSAVVADMPFPPPEAIFRNAPYMLGSTLHFKPMLNGYSGFLPPSYVAHYAQLASFPSAESIAALRRIGVTHIFVHRDRLTADAAGAVARLPGLHAMSEQGSIALYRLMSDNERH
jgi:hypothetical protein